jgi:hypothetical protein
MNNDNNIDECIENEKQTILKNLKLNKKEDFTLIQVYLDLLEKYKKYKDDKQLYENIKILEKYIFI